MEENVALDATKQKKFVKSIKGIKKLIKKNEIEKPTDEETVKLKKEKRKRKRPDRGLVYLSHIPHGFYEHQMTEYFKQFGVVTNARVIKSRRTGNSKGYAFVEFREPAVAEIVAETMNNYLMGKRLIKAAVIPPEKQRKAFRKNWSRDNNPGRNARLAQKKAFNENKDEKVDLKIARKLISNLNRTKKKLSEMGINYDFFTPVDIPEALQDSQIQKESNDVEDKKESKKVKKEDSSETNIKKQPIKNGKDSDKKVKKETVKETKKGKVTKNEDQKPDVKKDKKEVPVVNKKDQKQKQQKLKDAGMKPPENFIKVQEHSDDDDSSVDFDSDEYEKMIDNDGSDDSADSGDDSDEVSDENDTDDVDDSGDEEILPPPKPKGKGPIVAQPKKEVNKHKGKTPEVVKRKAPQPPVIAKKPKFEKQTQQPLKKQFKKKK